MTNSLPQRPARRTARKPLSDPYSYVRPQGDFTVGKLFQYPERALQAAARSTRVGKGTTVCIIGGGIAGLVAAYELTQRTGCTVTLLEAEDRFGGRIRTHYFDRNHYGELGAMRIPTDHHGVHHYITALGLATPEPLRPFVMKNPDAFYYFRGPRIAI